MLNPIMLYDTEKKRHVFSTFFEYRDMFRKEGSRCNLDASTIASEEGVNLKISSETAIQTSDLPSAPASFKPSPIIITFLCFTFNFSIYSNLSEGD